MKLKKTNLLITLFTSISSLFAQTEPLVSQSNSNLTVHTNGTISVFGNYYNNATVGNVDIKEGGKIVFYGDSFSNTALINGYGEFVFKGPRPAPYAGVFTQNVNNDGFANSIGNITLNNASGIIQSNNIAHVRDTFRFISGNWTINNGDLTVGNGDTGVLLGFTQNRYFNTQGTGKIWREGVDNHKVIYPVGTGGAANYYPAAIQNAGTTDRFGTRVFDNVLEDVSSGSNKNIESVQKVWDIREGSIGGSDVTLSLQHNNALEGSLFNSRRNKHYISRYIGYSPNTKGDTVSGSNWDLLFYSNLGQGSTQGTLTTGTNMVGHTVTIRLAIDTFGYFTKTVYSVAPLPIELIRWTAKWNQTNPLHADLVWKVAQEIDLNHYELYRSFDGIIFNKIKDIQPLMGSNSYNPLTYIYQDKNIKDLIEKDVFYRLFHIDNSGGKHYHGLQTLNNEHQNGVSLVLDVYPNPAVDYIRFTLNSPLKKEFRLEVFNVNGKLIKRFDLQPNKAQNAGIINTKNWAPGMYFIRFTSGHEVVNKKVEILK